MSFRTRLALVYVVLAVFAVESRAQGDRGSIGGVVVDSQGLAIPATRIALANPATGIQTETSTTESGNFLFTGLLPGTYNISARFEGFKAFSQTGVQVDVGRTTSLRISMEPGQVQETITVEGAPPILDTQTSDTGTAVTRRQIQDLPMPLTADSRNPMNFAILAPGVSGSVPGATPDLRLHVSGAPTNSTEVYIDGIPIADTNETGNINANHPSVDAVGEFKISNNNQSAEYGLSSGVISFTFRSGTNELHGSLYEYFQNESLNALDFPTKARGGAKAPLRQNEYGFTLGGPVVLPKLYNGRNRTFFFTSFTGFRYRPSSNNPNLTTFPNRFRDGDFSQLLGGQMTAPDPNTGNLLPVLDAAGRPVMTGAIYDPRRSRTVIGPDGGSYVVRDPFPGNRIPTSDFNLVSRNILPYYPKAETDALFNNFFRTTGSKVDQERFVGKIDQYLSGRHHLAGSIFLGTNLNADKGSLTLLEAIQVDQPSLHARLSYNFTQSPTLIHNFAFGFLRDKNASGPVEPGPGLGALGLSGIELPKGAPFPLISIDRVNGLGHRTFQSVTQNRFIVSDSVTWVKGSHTLKFGGELRRLQLNEFPINAGTYTFTPTQTALNGLGFINTS